MAKVTDVVAQLATPVVEQAGCSLWDVEYVKEAGEWFLRVYIDKEGGVSIDIQQVKGLKNKLLGGEGFFNTVLTGPGKIWLQTMPISGVASALIPYLPTGGNS